MSIAHGLDYAPKSAARSFDDPSFSDRPFGDAPFEDRLAARAAFRRHTNARPGLQIAKRIFDLTLAIVLLPVLVPLIAVLWALTRRDGGPGFFGHARVGKNGRSFKCWKIRTMVVDAETRLAEYLAADPAAAAEWTRDHKLQEDPRVTRLGRFLRKTSLDELPQIWNVLKGEMSFVGPRPVTRVEMRRYGRFRTAYLSLKPGITGLWQVNGRNDVTYDERVQMDVTYLRTMSIWDDIKIIAKTAGAVLDRTGK